jgi:pimeloyl-ACP methyl ester carboxylesterase
MSAITFPAVHWYRGRRGLIGAVLGGLALVVAAGAGPALAAGRGGLRPGGVSCRAETVPAALAAGQPARYRVWGLLCATRRELAAGATVQFLVPGATYDHAYWEFGTVDGHRYDYARAVAAAGFPAFDIDEIGVGRSSHPLSTRLTFSATAYVNHQVIQALLHGGVAGTRFGRVIAVGHSYGSYLTWEEAGTYRDVAGIIITGLTHYPIADPDSVLGTAFYPAIDDPKFAGSGLDPGYLTTVPGDRARLFYGTADSDPAMVAADEARKDVVSVTGLSGGLQAGTTGISGHITAPVLIVMGADDALSCGPITPTQNIDCASPAAVEAAETPLYQDAPSVHACSVPGSGHSIALALNHGLENRDAITWSRAFIGQRGQTAGGRRAWRRPRNCD